MTKSTLTTTDVLRGAREAKGWGLRDTAARVGTDAAHLSRVERGLSQPSIALLTRLAQVLDLKDLTRYLAPFAAAPEHATAEKATS